MNIELNSEDWQVRFRAVPKRYLNEGQVPDDWDGVCDFKRRLIYVTPNATALVTLVHEALHASFPDLNEDAVMRAEMNLKNAIELFAEWEANQ
jgi:hypothetical protein